MLLVLDCLSLIDRTSLILFPWNNIADKESKESSDDNKLVGIVGIVELVGIVASLLEY